jgi:PKD repeat protein
LRVLTSHELGHNFSCQHDAPGSGFIMAPSVNSSNSWSNASINAVNNFVPNLGCLGSCSTAQPPVANFTGSPTEGCAPFSVQYTDLSTNSPFSWDWSFPGGTPSTSTQQNPTVTYNTDGVYSATLTVSNNAGSDTYTRTNYIDVTEDPVADFTYFDNELVVEFFNTSVRADILTWDFGDGSIPISGPPGQNIPGGTHQGRTFGTFGNPTHVYDMDGTYVVTLTAVNDCGASQRTIAVEVVSPVSADFTSDEVDGCVTLEVNYESQSSYNVTQWFWEFPGGTPSTSNQENPQVFYENEGEYNVVLEVQNSRYVDRIVRTKYITARDVPATAFTHQVNNKSVAFTNKSKKANTLLWDFGDGGISNQQNPVHTYQEDSTYTVMLIGTNSCGNDTAFATILIGSPPSAGFTSDVTEGCPSLTVNFENLSSPNATHYEWEFSGGDPETSINKNPTVTYENSGEYTVVLIAHNGVGSDTVTVTKYIDVKPLPIADFGSDVEGYEVEFTNQSQFGNNYSWDFGDGNTSNAENPGYTYDLDGTYTVKLTVENDCGQDVIEKTVVIANPPAAGFTQDTLGGCADLTVEFENQSSENSVSYEWHFPGGTPDTSYEENPVVLYDSAGVYDVTLIAFNPQGTDTLLKKELIEINEEPVAAFESDIDMEMVFFMNESIRTDTFVWNFGDGNTSTDENPVHQYESNGIYEVWLWVENECGKDSVMHSVEIDAFPTADFEAEEQKGCSPFEVQYFNNSSQAASYEWEFEGGNPAVSTDAEPIVTYTEPGTYMVQLVVSNGVGSDIKIIEKYIEVLPDPVADFDFAVNGYTTTFMNVSSNATSYSWNFGDGNMSAAASPMHEYELPGSYLVELIASGTCGTDTINETVEIVDQTPVITIVTSTNAGCPTLSVQFNDMSDNNPESWLWTFEGGNPASSTEQNPLVAFEEPGSYRVTLEVSNQYGSSKAVYDSLITVYNVPEPNFAFEQRGDTVVFTNMSSHHERLEWHFGDGNTSNEENPVHIYEANGVYEVTLVAINNCGSVTKQVELVIQVSGIFKKYELGDFTIYPNPNDGSFNIKMAQQGLQGDITLEIRDMFGRSIDRSTLNAFDVMRGVHYLMPQQLSGTYFVILRQANKVSVRKIVVIN